MEERDTDYWLDYLRCFAKKIAFYQTENNHKAGTWERALPDKDELSLVISALQDKRNNQPQDAKVKSILARPDFVLLASFLDILQHPQQQFNQLTDIHQQFYFRRILGLKEQPPVADSAHIFVSLHPNTPSMTLLKNTSFDAGKDSQGQPLVYQTNENSVLNQAKVSRISTLTHFTEALTDHDSTYLLTHLLDQAEGVELPEQGGLTFGEDRLNDVTRQQYPAMGFTLTSPLLWLEGGQRTINIRFDKELTIIYKTIAILGDYSSECKLSNWFNINISTSEGWLPVNLWIKNNQVNNQSDLINSDSRITVNPLLDNENDDIGIHITFDDLFPAIVPLPSSQNDSPSNPTLSFSIKPGIVAKNHYDKLADLLLAHLELSVTVTGLRSLKLNNQATVIDPTKPFEPFGNQPRIKSRLYFTHPELLIKNIQTAYLFIDWLDKPDNFSVYYKAYSYYRYCEQQPEPSNKADYLAINKPDSGIPNKNCSELQKNEYLNKTCNCLLWPENKVKIITSDNQPNENPLSLFNSSGIELTHHLLQQQPYPFNSLPLTEVDPIAWPHWYSVELVNNDFGHGDYAKVAEYFAYRYASQINNNQSNDDNLLVQVPQPYTPLINRISLNYTAFAHIKASEATKESSHQIQLIHPMGKQYLADSKPIGPYSIVPSLPHSGYLYIGLADLPIPGQVNLYFQLDPIDSSNISPGATIRWSYLHDNQWVKFLHNKQDPSGQQGAILADSTNGLLDAGIIQFNLPASVSQAETLFGDELVWLRASLSDSLTGGTSPFYSVIRGIYAQGIKVTFTENNNAHDHLASPLPEGSINSLINNDLRIEDIEQPFPSFGGKVSETPEQFAIRSSEHLRHKGRALSAWDYEHLLLAKFPELYMARCIRDLNGTTGLTSINIVVIPKTYNSAILQPKVPLYLKRQMARYIQSLSSSSFNVNIIDPIYEQVVFDIRISINEGFDSGSELHKLNQLLVSILVPWKHKQTEEVTNIFHTQHSRHISITDVVALLESQPALNNVLSIQAYRKEPNGNRHYYDSNVIQPSQPHAILVPAKNQEIKLFTTMGAVFQGIGMMEIEFDFIIAE